MFVGSIQDEKIVTSCSCGRSPFDHVSTASSWRQFTVSETFLIPSPGASFHAREVCIGLYGSEGGDVIHTVMFTSTHLLCFVIWVGCDSDRVIC